jgi:hypothetical protein
VIEGFATAPLADVSTKDESARRPDSRVAVLELRGAIGRDMPISERSVRSFLSLNTYLNAERLHLAINSTGGKVDEANKIYAILRSLPLPISAEVETVCQSAAVILLLAADFRRARRAASVLIHRTRAIPREFLGEEFMTAPQHSAIGCGLLHEIDGWHRFSMSALSYLDHIDNGPEKPSSLLAMNYRQAARVAAMVQP